jgi:hypothetical protein
MNLSAAQRAQRIRIFTSGTGATRAMILLQIIVFSLQ